MKLFLHLMVLIVAAALGLIFGFLWRGDTGHNSKTLPQSTTFILSNQSPPPPVAMVPVQAPIPPSFQLPLVDQLERDLSMSSGVTRWLYWLEAIEKAQLEDFSGLARLAADNPAALSFVAARWMELNPRHLFDALVAAEKAPHSLPTRQLSSLLFKEWPKRDPDNAITALNESANWAGARNAQVTVAMAVIENDAERGLKLLSDWHIENIGMGQRSLAKWAAADPRHAAEYALNHDAGYVSEMAMKEIGQAWSSTDPVAALEFAAAHPGRLGSKLAEATMKKWSETSLDNAADWLAKTDPPTRNRLSKIFVEALAKEDVDRALVWSAENLSGTSLARAVGGVVKGAAANDIHEAASLVNELNPSPARSEAAKAVGAKWFPDRMDHEPVSAEAIAWLQDLDPDSTRHVLENIQWTWVANDPESMADFLVSAPFEAVPPYADRALARQLAREDPLAALAWAEQLSPDRAKKAGGEAFNTWRTAQPEAAMQWLHDLPASDPRRETHFRSAIETLAHHPQAEQQLAAMNGTERTAARRVIETMKIPDSRRTLLLQATR